jgi:hypothetical protein
MDNRIDALTPWQQVVYKLCWKVGTAEGEEKLKAAAELDRMKMERPEEYKAAFDVWLDIMYEVLY